jgi:hypothetical protein
MKANAVFIHKQYPRAALQVAHDQFFAIETRRRHDLALTDEVTGDLLLEQVKWMFNVTRSTLIQIKVLGRYSSLPAAVGATKDIAVQR